MFTLPASGVGSKSSGRNSDKRCRPHLKPTNKSYRVDETYIKVKRPRPVPVSGPGFNRADH